MTKQEAKEFVHKTLKTGNKERIIEVMNKYWQKTQKNDTYKTAQETLKDIL